MENPEIDPHRNALPIFHEDAKASAGGKPANGATKMWKAQERAPGSRLDKNS